MQFPERSHAVRASYAAHAQRFLDANQSQTATAALERQLPDCIVIGPDEGAKLRELVYGTTN